jgi:hypothetical protein
LAASEVRYGKYPSAATNEAAAAMSDAVSESSMSEAAMSETSMSETSVSHTPVAAAETSSMSAAETSSVSAAKTSTVPAATSRITRGERNGSQQKQKYLKVNTCYVLHKIRKKYLPVQQL